MTPMPVAAFGPSLSFRVSRHGGRLAAMQRTLAVARAQGDRFTAELVEHNLRRIAGPAVELPRLSAI